MNIRCIRHISHVFPIACLLFAGMNGNTLYAQDTINKSIPDTIFAAPDKSASSAPDSKILTVSIGDETVKLIKKDAATFKPNPQTAYKIAAIFPGMGQIYNRQYWKLPIVYGGVAGFLYAITWNNKNYQDYRQAYFDIVADKEKDPSGSNPGSWSKSWQDFIPNNADPATYFNNGTLQSNLKAGKDFYRRNRDLSIILSIAFYLICVADAYVDAQMFDFDVSPDLSLRITPQIQNSVFGNSKNFGFNICMNF